MILSNVGIQKAMDAGYIVIDPRPSPERRKEKEGDCPYQTTAVDLRLSDELVRLREGLPIVINLSDGKLTNLTKDNGERIKITREQPYKLMPGKFILGQTYEKVMFKLPQKEGDPCFAARIEGRSSYARCGLTVHLTAPTIHAGFGAPPSGRPITLELCNFGPYPINLTPMDYICQLIIERVDGVPFPNESQFHHQTTPDGLPKR